MTTTDFAFENAAGHRLAGVLETEGVPRAFALFAHCFTCDKSSLAAVRISRALAARGIAVLRFDFTGLGESEGDFGEGLSGDVADIVCAVRAMQARDMPVSLLVGHSFGGAAALAAAGRLDGVGAVAVIGAPADAEHVLTHIEEDLDSLPAGATVPVEIAGRAFRLGAAFATDIRAQRQHERIAGLGRALLVLHSPLDDVVSIDNASEIFGAARHPKSFVSLDDADHLLRRREDADYAAGVIAAWAERYLEVVEPAAEPAPHGVRVANTGVGRFQVRITTSATTFLADEPISVGGLNSGPTPYDLLSAALGACTAMTCKLYAQRKGWPLVRAVVDVGHSGRKDQTPDRFVRWIDLQGNLDDQQRARLMEIADRCPIHRTLTEGAQVRSELRAATAVDTNLDDQPEDHVVRMTDACDDMDGAHPNRID